MLTKLALLVTVFSIFTVAAKAQDFVGSVKASLDHGSLEEAQAKLNRYRSARGVTPEFVEAYSWLGRDALARGDYRSALQYSDQTAKLVAEQLRHRPLDAEPRIPTALGAAIEVRGQALAKMGDRAEAIEYLSSEAHKYRKTSIAARIQKNINLLGLVGKPAPALHLEPHLGPKPEPLTALRGKPVLLFLWAHWCADCKGQAPIIARLQREYGTRFSVIGATRLYGYAAEGLDAPPDRELAYIDSVRQKYYSTLSDMPVPVSTENFLEYGVSTTPTLVLIGGEGRVRLYHPGRMTYEELKAELEKAFLVKR